MSYYEIMIAEIDKDYDKIKDFDKDLLFLNIYNFWCFSDYLCRTALDRLKTNLKKSGRQI